MKISPGCTKGGGEPWRRDISAKKNNRRVYVKQSITTCKTPELRVRLWFIFSLQCPEICVVVRILKPECVYYCWTHSCILLNSRSMHMPILRLLCRLVYVFPHIKVDKTTWPLNHFIPDDNTQKCIFNAFLKLAIFHQGCPRKHVFITKNI